MLLFSSTRITPNQTLPKRTQRNHRTRTSSIDPLPTLTTTPAAAPPTNQHVCASSRAAPSSLPGCVARAAEWLHDTAATHLHALGDAPSFDLPPGTAQLLAVEGRTCRLAGDGDPPGLLRGKPPIWSPSRRVRASSLGNSKAIVLIAF